LDYSGYSDCGVPGGLDQLGFDYFDVLIGVDFVCCGIDFCDFDHTDSDDCFVDLCGFDYSDVD
jgi:hypothetical protein